jgi:hypothetical protein
MRFEREAERAGARLERIEHPHFDVRMRVERGE